MRWIALVFLLTPASAEVVTTRTIERGQVLVELDLQGPEDEVSRMLGQVARRPLRRGRPVRPYDLERATAVVRQQSVTVLFQRGPLTLRTEGRALRGGIQGEWIDIALKGRRRALSAKIVSPGVVEVP